MYEEPLEDWEDPEPDEQDEDRLETLPCPSCGEAIYEDAEQCPYCGEYVKPGSTLALAGRPLWFIVLGLLGLLAMIVVLLLCTR